ncbi:TetR/AcrR family transcriptional regulator C-terminal ligand-binding domain-containing protein [Streptomyces atroolivaceus]|uniref:TetR/AcrR family transcriptional regulator n=1 Tax=Streptomyces atroolivaceus TaxID=66869 RepID=UPI00365A65F6
MSQPRRARRTQVEVQAAITQGVLAELEEVGFAALTYEGVARRAEVSKPVLYRRHSSRVSLVLTALQEAAQNVYAEPPATGSLRSDLLSWIATAQAMASRVGAATLRGLVGEASESELEHVATLMGARVRDIERCVIEPARRRGELSGAVPAPVIELLFTLIRDRTLFGRLDEPVSASLVDHILLPLLTAGPNP